MNRRGFLKNFGISASVVAVPTTLLASKNDEFDIDKWEKQITQEVQVFYEKTSQAVFQNKTELLPVDEYFKIKSKIGDIMKHCLQEEDLPLDDIIIDRLFKGLIKYEYQRDQMLDARKWEKQWRYLWTNLGDEFMRKTDKEVEYCTNTMFYIQTKIYKSKGYGKLESKFRVRFN